MKTCEQCLWFDECPSDEPCTHFTPVEDDYKQIIEENRAEFRQEWLVYACREHG